MDSISVADMRILEINAMHHKLSLSVLMENAGREVARVIFDNLRTKSDQGVVFAGLGGNGGDGMVVLRHLHNLGISCNLLLLGSPSNISHPSTKLNYEILTAHPLNENIQICKESSSLEQVSIQADFLVDAMLGTGVCGSIREPIKKAIKLFNDVPGKKYAIDIPTGLDPNTGKINSDGATMVDTTIALHKPKTGLLVSKVKKYTGEIRSVPIGIPSYLEELTGPGDLYPVHKGREPTSHKGDNGRMLIIAGSHDYYGAAYFTAISALRAGADLAYLICPESIGDRIASNTPDIILRPYKESYLTKKATPNIAQMLSTIDCVILGPGIGNAPETLSILPDLIDMIREKRIPCVLDGDCFKIFSEIKPPLGHQFILTPHSSEFELLEGIPTPPPNEVQQRISSVSAVAKKYQCTIVLKGPIDVISNGTQVKINTTGNSGMTVGGTGDLLAGLIGGFFAQSKQPFYSSTAGAFLMGYTGDLVYQEKGPGLLASDILSLLPNVIHSFSGLL